MEIEEERLCRYVHHHYVLDVDVLHDTATAAAALEAEADVCAEETAVGNLDVLHSARHLAADHESAVSMEHDAVVDDQVAARPCPSAAVLVLS